MCVFPSRAEGWNLEALEMMSVGRPVIITNYSAHTEFCNNKNSSLIDVNDTEAAYDGIWFDGNVGDWATIDVDVLGSLMLSSYKEGPIFNQHGVNTANNFTWRNAALSVQKGLD
jgi:glycosyltransferase involved in cell wall biosynthesis